MNPRDSWTRIIHRLQDEICAALEAADGLARFTEEAWERPEGGGGKTRVIRRGSVFEKGGVNSSVVHGEVSDILRGQLHLEGDRWFACGLSIVLHPFNPFVPSIQCNYRMFELYGPQGDVVDRWFGGGTDLTPYYLFEEDVRHFHGTYQAVCDAFDPSFYALFKRNCDDYFVNWHRDGERRGLGGIFFDFQRPGGGRDVPFWLGFGEACGNAFIPSYLPIVEKRKDQPFSNRHKEWQEIRRGRYTEFNLLHDRGTLFGLRTHGRIESILMSLPPTVRFEYDHRPEPDSEEDKLLQACLHPRDWAT